MAIKTVLVDSSNVEYFAGCDPFSYVDTGLPDTCFMVGAVRQADSGDEPTGLIICESYYEYLIIRWLYVCPEYRGQGYGDALLSAAFDAGAAGKKTTLAVMFGNEPERKLICPGEREYFAYHGFDREEIIGISGNRMLCASLS